MDLNMKILVTIVILPFLAILTWGMGNKYKNTDFAIWDTDKNDLISYEEFKEVFPDLYVNIWKTSDKRIMNDVGFFKLTYSIWDANNDKVMSKDEWLYGYSYLYGDYVYAQYEVIEKDNDGFIQLNEYIDAFYETGFFSNWDLDHNAALNEFELSQMFFNSWDDNDNEFIEYDEYNDLGVYYLNI